MPRLQVGDRVSMRTEVDTHVCRQLVKNDEGVQGDSDCHAKGHEIEYVVVVICMAIRDDMSK